MFKKTLFATAATVLLSMPVMAADVVEAPVEVPSWTGFYLGGGIKAAWSDFDTGAKYCNEWIDECFKLNDPDVFYWVDWLSDGLFNGDSDTAFRGIVQAGFDWEMTPGFVLGVFGDYNFGQATGGSNKEVFEDYYNNEWIDRNNKLSYGIDDMWTLGGRLGWATESALFYGLLGYTWADAEAKLKLGCFEDECWAVAKDGSSVDGVTFGAGVEFKGWLWDTASTAIEYRYIDLDDISRKTWLDNDEYIKSSVSQDVQEVLLTFKWRFGEGL